MIAENTVDQLEHEIVGIGFALAGHVGIEMPEHLGAYLIIVLGEECLKPLSHTLLLGGCGDAEHVVVHGALRLLDSKLAEQEECTAGE